MTKAARSSPPETNFSFNLLKPVDRDFKAALQQGCFQKKALLARLLELEIEQLDAAIDTPVPKKVTQFIREIQNEGSLKKAWIPDQVQLPTRLVDRIQEVCKSKGVLRDAWVNRVLFLATATKLFDVLMPLDEFERFDYFKDNKNNLEDAVVLASQRLTAPIDPLFRLHAAFRQVDEPEETGPWDLYRFKVYAARRKPRKPMPNLQASEVSDKDRTLRTDWMIHKFAWSITCWAEVEDLDQLEEPEYDDFLGL